MTKDEVAKYLKENEMDIQHGRAAIVSRELGIPCIIGTRSATRQLKTGDKIKLDLEKGIITKI